MPEQEELMKKVTSAFSAPEGSIIDDPSAAPVVESKVEPIVESVAPGHVEFTPSPIWNVFKEKLGIEPPEDLTPDNELEIISKTIESVKPAEVQLHPMALDLNNRLSDPEFKFEDWVGAINSRQNTLSLSGKDFLAKALPLEYPDATEDDINELIQEFENAGRVKAEELRMKRDLRQKMDSEQQQYVQQVQQRQTEVIQKANEQTQAELDKLFAETKNLNEIYGIPISEAEKESFNRTFSELARRDEKGEMPLMGLLQSNLDLWSFAYFVLNGNSKIKEALFNAKEGTKAEMWKKLRATPTAGPGKATGTPGPNKPDYSRLKEPQQ